MIATPFLLYLLPIFTVFGGDGQPILVWVTDDIDAECNHMHVRGCVTDIGIITQNPFAETPRGCNVLTHEYFHVLNYNEAEIPYCEISQEFR